LISVHKDDVLRALKRFRRLAKQDLLMSEHTSDPAYWKEQAEARRRTYAALIEWVSQRGVDAAHEEAIRAYAALPLLRAKGEDPVTSGSEQAFELFFLTIGIAEKELVRMRNGRRKRQSSASDGRKAEKAVLQAGI